MQSVVAGALILGVALLVGGGSFLWNARPEAEPVAASAPPTPAPEPLPPPPTPPEPPMPTTPTGKPDAVDPAAPAEPAPRGDGTVTGRIVDERGAPIARLRTRLLIHSGEIRWDERVRETTTDEDGRYSFSNLPREEVVVRAEKRGYEIAPVDVLAYMDCRPDAVVDFVGKPVPSVSIRVVGPDGAPFGPVKLVDATRQPTNRSRDAAGWYLNLRSGAVRLRAVSEPRGDLVSDFVTIDPANLPPGGVVEFQLRQRSGVSGRVVFPDDRRPPDSVAVRLQGSDEDIRVEATSADGFRFVLPEVPPGEATLRVTDTKFAQYVFAQRTVTVTSGTVQADVTVPASEPTRTFVVSVIDPGGEKVRILSAETELSGSADLPSTRASWSRGGDGSVVVQVQWPPEYTSGRIVVDTDGFGRLVAPLARSSKEPVVLFARKPARLDVVVDGLRPDAPRLAVEATPLGQPAAPFMRALTGETDAEGRVQLAALSPGRYRVEVSSGASPRRVFGAATVELTSGPSTVRIDVSACRESLAVEGNADRKFWFATITPLAADGRPDGLPIATEQTDEQGRAKFTLLRPGAYLVEMHGETRRVEVPKTATLKW
jgi:hypothetical protein